MSVYPNPASGQVKIKMPKGISRDGILTITNQFGLVIYTRKVNAMTETLDVDLSRFNKGVYQISLKAGNEIRNAKIIKK